MFASFRRSVLFAIYLSFLAAPNLGSQLIHGMISGSVVDPTGATISGAAIRIEYSQGGGQQEAKSNDRGEFSFLAVEAGTYEVRFEAHGFSNTFLQNIMVRPGSRTIINQTMQIEVAISSITVVARESSAKALEMTGANDEVFDKTSLEILPLAAIDRDPTRLTLLSSSVVRAPGFGELSANGQRTRQNSFAIDGTEDNDLSVTGAISRLVPEALESIQVRTSAFSAESGSGTGAHIEMLTRRGGSSLHGGVWEYFRSDWLEPLSLQNKRAGLTHSPRFVQNQFGGSLGGPLDRGTFFWGLIDLNRLRGGPDSRNATTAVIPTKTGYAALSSLPLGLDQTTQSRRNILNSLSFLESTVYSDAPFLQNVSSQLVNGTRIETGTILIPLATPTNTWLALGRIDHKIGERKHVSIRTIYDDNLQKNTGGNRQFGEQFSADSLARNQNHVISFNSSIGENAVDESRVSFTKSSFTGIDHDPNNPSVRVLGLFSIGGASTYPQGRSTNSFQWQNNLGYTKSHDTIKLGGTLRRIAVTNRADFDSKGTFTFLNLADFLNNQAANVRQSLTTASYYANQYRSDFFLQSELRFGSSSIITTGIRYEFATIPLGFLGASRELASAGVPLPTKADLNNLAPRAGIAFSPASRSKWSRWFLGEQQTVVRAGYGISYDTLFYNLLTATASNFPRVAVSDIGPPLTNNLYPLLGPQKSTNGQFDPLLPFVNVQEDAQAPTTHFWEATIHREWHRSRSIDLAYTGSRSYHLIRQSERNPGTLSPQQAALVISGSAIPSLQQRRLNPSWGQRTILETTALSTFNGFQARFRARFGGSTVQGNYSWSTTLSDNDEAFPIREIVTSSPPVPQNYLDYSGDWSRSVFDRPHRVTTRLNYQLPSITSHSPRIDKLFHLIASLEATATMEWQSGQPFTILTGVDSGGSGVPASISAWRPNLNLGGTLFADSVSKDLRTFATPQIDGRFITPLNMSGTPLANSMSGGGNLGRNTLRGPAFSLVNISLAYSLPLKNELRARLRADFFNVLNHRNFGNPIGSMSNPLFGKNISDPGCRTVLLGIALSF